MVCIDLDVHFDFLVGQIKEWTAQSEASINDEYADIEILKLVGYSGSVLIDRAQRTEVGGNAHGLET